MLHKLLIQSILISSIFVLLFLFYNFATENPKASVKKGGHINIEKSVLRGRLEIINGQDAEDDAEFPFQLKLFDGGHFSCGAAIIGHRFGITAAHCLRSCDHPQYYEVIAGSINYVGNSSESIRHSSGREHEQRRQVTSIRLHPEYNSHNNDIAVFSVDENFTFNKWVKNIRIPQPDLEEDPGEVTGQDLLATVTGWGVINETEMTHPKILQKLEMPIVDCDDFFDREQIPQKDSVICAGKMIPFNHEPPAGVCYGDSGGPLFLNSPPSDPLLIGLTSRLPGGIYPSGLLCGAEPQVFTKVGFFTKWIHDTISQLARQRQDSSFNIIQI